MSYVDLSQTSTTSSGNLTETLPNTSEFLRRISNAPAKILAIGAVMVDTVCRIERLPLAGEGIVVQKQGSHLGGCAFNSAWTAQLLGSSCTLFAPLGEGLYASFIRAHLEERNLVPPFQEKGIDNGNCTCLVDNTGERTMITTPGIERHFKQEWFEAIDARDYAATFVSGYEIEGEGGNNIIAFLESNPHLEVYYAPGPRIIGVGPEKTARINALNPLWHLNDQEALTYTGAQSVQEAARTIAEETQNAVVITLGSNGALCLDNDRFFEVAAPPITPLDTVGAGDAHLGALVAARAAGLNWEDSLTLANHVASRACLCEGAILFPDAFLS